MNRKYLKKERGTFAGWLLHTLNWKMVMDDHPLEFFSKSWQNTSYFVIFAVLKSISLSLYSFPTEERLCNMIADSIEPRLVPNVEMMTIEDKTVLVVEVFLSGLRPHYLKTEGPEKGVLVRLGSTNRQADRELIGELRRSAEGISF